MYLIGNSIDIHTIELMDCKIKLGGLKFSSKWKIIANSDGDIILHVIAESIYGALGLGDLGDYFPEKNLNIKNINSILIIEDALSKMKKEKYAINNIDITIICEYIFFKKIKNKILEKLFLITNCKKINLKATRWEENKKIIQANCIVLLIKETNNEK